MNTMTIIAYLLALVGVIIGFMGLIIIIKGFADKSNKKIHLGTILVCITLAIAVTGGFCAARHAIKFVRYHASECQKGQMDFNKCCGFKFNHKGMCASGDTTITSDSTCVKVIVEKTCVKEGEKSPCPHHNK
ncbi:MAG: hypothetical protein PHR81_10410 [Bacteroidales bacterium]|jgi:hypothetical protein|nr:hypothetical protein [Bacteroidales bacterium]MDD4215213.1 hypothetical protein [Bacteroidales bacterium]